MNIKNFALVFALFLSFTTSLRHQAQANTNNNCTDLIRQIADLDLSQKQGWRGFLGINPDLNKQTGQAATERNIMYWGQPIYLVTSKDQIIDHDVIQTNILIKGMYVVVDHLPKDKSEVPKLVAEGAQKNGVYFVNYNADLTKLVGIFAPLKGEELLKQKREELKLKENAVLTQVNPQFVKDNFLESKVDVKIDAARRNELFGYLWGWFQPENKGVIKHSDFENSSTLKNISQLARKFNREGFKVLFNHNINAVVGLLAKQDRFEKDIITGDRVQKDSSVNRFARAENRQVEIDRFNAGHAFTVEVWSPDGKLIAGNFGHRAGNILSPDSIFYDKSAHPQAFEMAKISVIAILERAAQAGIPFIDAGMVTNFTAGLKGQYVKLSEYEKLLQTLPETILPIDFTSEWMPPEPKKP